MKSISTFLFSLIFLFANAQDISWEFINPMPERVTNNAVTQATVGGVPYVYSFAGIDSTKACGNPHLKSFRYNTETDFWESIAPLPDALGGKIAAGASTIKNKIYIIGGYHVDDNCGEISSEKVHIFNPETNTYMPNGADIPVPIDDQVQAVWKDSLIYVITGWSDFTNVIDVQIYNPTTDEWMAGTPIINNSEWRVFGASGVIIGNEIYYIGGASSICNSISCFAATTMFRKGIINPDNPTEIAWEGEENPASQGYRMAATTFGDIGLWFGGSDITYNFNGIDYNGTGGVAPLNRVTIFDPAINFLNQEFGFIPSVMDLRGIAKISENEYIIAGGMIENQTVTNQAFKVTINDLTAISDKERIDLNVFPNPTSDILNIELEGNFDIEIRDVSGKMLKKQSFNGNSELNISDWENGIYFLNFFKEEELVGIKRIVKI